MLEITRDTFELGIILHDAPAMHRFYGDVLGLERESSLPIPGVGVRHKYRYGTNSIKLIELDTPVGHAPAPGLPWAAAGLRYWTADVRDIAAVLERLAAAGANVLVELQEPFPGIRYAIVADPDGNGIELVEGA